MSVFADDRAAIATALDTTGNGWAVHDHLPGRAVPPCYIVLHDSPLVVRESTDPFGSATTRYEVWAIAGTGANDVETASVEDGTEHAIEALMGAGFDFESVDQPVTFELNGNTYLAISIHITSTVRFTRKAA